MNILFYKVWGNKYSAHTTSTELKFEDIIIFLQYLDNYFSVVEVPHRAKLTDAKEKSRQLLNIKFNPLTLEARLQLWRLACIRRAYMHL